MNTTSLIGPLHRMKTKSENKTITRYSALQTKCVVTLPKENGRIIHGKTRDIRLNGLSRR